ncbi:MAG: ArsR family transcriptional regulator, partial [bacterium]|nr:ArsR family transcriptional regulator [bacterium]
CKGFASHRRIEILTLLAQEPNLSLVDLSEKTQANMKTISVHVQRMHNAGLLYKTSNGAAVRHTLSPLGNNVLKFLRTLE